VTQRDSKLPPAFKHGGYSGATLLPGEDPAAFKKLHRDLIAEHTPVGRLEEDIVETIARIIWRKQNLGTYLLVTQATTRYDAIYSKHFPDTTSLPMPWIVPDTRSPEEIERARQEFQKQARKELGQDFELADSRWKYTIEYMLGEWSVIDRLDSMIDRCLKRLLMVRGIKSMPSSAPTAPPPARKRVTAT